LLAFEIGSGSENLAFGGRMANLHESLFGVDDPSEFGAAAEENP